MRAEQERVKALITEYGLQATAQARCLDLISEVGEVAKELLKATDYGKNSSFIPTRETEEELGDCLFSLLALCDSLGISAREALEGAMKKYHIRWETRGSVDSGR